jgi:DNA-directed RNA polymerase subunit RPC12/RpoP
MPIRFRCQHCSQLLGIARRKAGTAVECPTCHERVLVPFADTAAAPQGGDQPLAPSPPAGTAAAHQPSPLFEGSDFDEILQNHFPNRPIARVEAPARPAAPQQAAAPVPFDFQRAPAPAASAPAVPAPSAVTPVVGIILSPTQATLLTVVAILLLALSFGAGLLVGHYWLG